jgi:hypothetical protein
VLAGLEIPAQDRDEFERFLEELGYPVFEETSNLAAGLFLG